MLPGPVLQWKGRRSGSVERLDISWDGLVSCRIVREDPGQSLEIIFGVSRRARPSWAPRLDLAGLGESKDREVMGLTKLDPKGEMEIWGGCRG